LPNFLKDIEPDFKIQLLELVPLLLSPENLVVKEIHGRDITGKELVEYFKVLKLILLALIILFGYVQPIHFEVYRKNWNKNRR